MSQPASNIHYKMYKQGRFWVFASMTLLTLQLAHSSVQADSVDDQVTPTSDTTNIDTDYQNSPTVTIGQHQNASASVNDQTESAINTDQSIPETVSPPSHDENEDNLNVPEANSVAKNNNLSASETTDTVADQIPSAKDTPSTKVSPDIDVPGASQKDTEDLNSQPTPPAHTETAVGDESLTKPTPDTEIVLDTQEFISHVPKPITENQAAKSVINVQSRLLKETTTVVDYQGFHDVTNIDSGIYGTCEWWVDQDIVLHLGAGTLPATNISRTLDDKAMPTQGTIPWKVYDPAYLENYQIKRITLEGKVLTNADASGLFFNLTSVTDIENLDYLDTSQATDLSYLFWEMLAIQHLDLSHFDTSNVVYMNNMFNWDMALTELDVSNFDTSNVTNMSAMFTNCTKLTTLDLTNFVTANVTDMSAMFTSCVTLTALDLSSFDTSQVTDMALMFFYNFSLSQLDLSTFDMRKVTANPVLPANFSHLPNLDSLKLNANVRFNLWDESLGMGAEDNAINTDEWTNITTHQAYTAAELRALYGEDTTIDQTYTYTRHKWVAAKDLTLYIGPKTTAWSPADNLISHSTPDGTNLTVAQLTPTLLDENGHEQTTVDLTIPNRTYTITYHDTYNSLPNDVVAKIYVRSSAAKIIGQDYVTFLGNPWQSTDNFISAVDVDGQIPVDFSQISVTHNVNTNQLGTYMVAYSFIDQAGNIAPMTPLTRSATNPTGFKVIVAGIQLANPTWSANTTDNWQPNTNLKQAIDQSGQDVTSQVKIQCRNQDGQPVTRLTKPGTYTVTYSYLGLPTATATVDVTTGATLNVKDTSIQLGAVWNPQTNFINATDVNGQAIGLDQLTFKKDAVNTQRPGQYQVDYTYTDSVGNSLTKTATVTVLAPVIIDAKDSTISLGDTWQPADNFISASDQQGQPVPFTQIKVSTTGVNTARIGQYQVTYTYISTAGHQATKTVTITVLAPATIQAKDSTLNVGETWQPTDNFISASDQQGNVVSFKQITVTTAGVDTSQAGRYQVTYTYGTATQTITVTVKVATVEPKPEQPDPEVPEPNLPDTSVPDTTVPDPSQPEQPVSPNPTTLPDTNNDQLTSKQPTDQDKANPVTHRQSTSSTTTSSVNNQQQQVAVLTTAQAQLALPKKSKILDPTTVKLPQTNAATRSTATFTGMLILALSSFITLLSRHLKSRRH